MKASDLLLKCLEREGIDTIYGVPGEENADVMISLLTSKIKFITCRHEQSAAFMADMHGRLTGKPGVCLATLGPGSTNLITGVANANMDHSPLIAIVGQASTHRLHKESHQNMDSVSMYKPVTKWSTTIREADSVPEVINKACKVAMDDKPGAVLIEFPEDIAKHRTRAKMLPKLKKFAKGVPNELCNNAIKLILKSKNPLLLVGNGCMREKCDSVILEFIEKTGIYVADTFMGKGVVSANHPQSLHCVGLGMKDIATEAFDQADLIICAGYDLVEWSPEHWNEKRDKKIIHIDTLSAETDEFYAPDLELVGDIFGIFEKLNKNLEEKEYKSQGFVSIKKKALKDLAKLTDDKKMPMKPQRALHDLRSVMRSSDVLISDVGAHKMWVARQYPTYESNTCFIYNGFCPMGGSMPAAFATKQLHPQKNVVALCGDGGFMMSIQAIVTAVREKVPMVVLLWDDDHFGLIKWKQEAHYNKSSHVDLKNPDLAKLAESFGCHGVKLRKAADLVNELKLAFKRKSKPTVIVIPIDYSENMKLTKRLGKIVCKS
jgi:acetolactate synthase I/II/III large subunit